MRIVIHDFGSYSFPVQLARHMARDGHEVHYLHSDFYEVKGAIEQRAGDPKTFFVHRISLGEKHQKYRFGQRALQEGRYVAAFRRVVDEIRPDWVISCNTPIIVAFGLAQYCRWRGFGYVHWAQDLHTTAITSILAKRNRVLGQVAGAVAKKLEQSAIEAARALVVISEDFLDELRSHDVRPKSSRVIPNWMPLDEMVPTPKVNPWSQRNGMAETLNLMYVGTLSLKHEIEPFVDLSRHFTSEHNVRIVVVAGGISFDELAKEKERLNLSNLVLFGWQKYEELSWVLGSGDVLFATISPDASRFSVPCKVLTYAAVGKPVLAHMPKGNLVSRIISDNQLGEVVECGDREGLLRAADKLVHDAAYRNACATRARAYAERTFDVGEKARDFYEILKAS